MINNNCRPIRIIQFKKNQNFEVYYILRIDLDKYMEFLSV